MLQRCSSGIHVSICSVRTLAFGFTRRSGCRWGCQECISHRLLERQAAEALLDSISTVVWTRSDQSRVFPGFKVTAPEQLRQPAAPPQSQSLHGLGSAHGVRVGCWLSLCYKEPGGAGKRKELTLGSNTSFSDAIPLHRRPLPGISNHGRQVFLLLHTSGSWIPAAQLLPSDRSFRDFIRIRKTS